MIRYTMVNNIALYYAMCRIIVYLASTVRSFYCKRERAWVVNPLLTSFTSFHRFYIHYRCKHPATLRYATLRYPTNKICSAPRSELFYNNQLRSQHGSRSLLPTRLINFGLQNKICFLIRRCVLRWEGGSTVGPSIVSLLVNQFSVPRQKRIPRRIRSTVVWKLFSPVDRRRRNSSGTQFAHYRNCWLISIHHFFYSFRNELPYVTIK